MAAPQLDAPARRADETRALAEPAPARRMLVIVNPHASTVSDRLKNLVVSALRARYDVQVVTTEAKSHAIDLGRSAIGNGYDVVVAFGGDGTVNEAINGLAGSDIPLTFLPGGRMNVYCRMLGIPNDVVDATEHLLGLADDWRPRRVDLARVNGRCFAFSSGAGLDASVVQRVDANPALKVRFGEYYYAWAGVSAFLRRYAVRPPRLLVEAGDERIEGVTAMVQNADPYTYFHERPVRLAEGATLDSGDLAGVVLTRASPLDVPTVAWRALSRRPRVTRHRHVRGFSGVREVRIRSVDGRELPLQVDGDHFADAAEAHYTIEPGGLLVVA